MTIYATVSKDYYSSDSSPAPSPTNSESSTHGPSSADATTPVSRNIASSSVSRPFRVSRGQSEITVAASNKRPSSSGSASSTCSMKENRSPPPSQQPAVFRPRPGKSAFDANASSGSVKPLPVKSSPVPHAGHKRSSSASKSNPTSPASSGSSSPGSKKQKTSGAASSAHYDSRSSHPYPYSHYPGYYPYHYPHYYPPAPGAHAPPSHDHKAATSASAHSSPNHAHPTAASRPPHAHAPPAAHSHSHPPHGYAWPYPPPPPHVYPHYYPPHYYPPHPTGYAHKSPASPQDKKDKNHKKKSPARRTKSGNASLKYGHASSLGPTPDVALSNPKMEDSVVERRSRKNAQSRFRANKLKSIIHSIQAKDPSQRTPEEAKKLKLFEERRLRKNGRSRERAMERKKRFALISAKPEDKWTEEEKRFMKETLVAKYKKNEGDRLRRKRMRENGDAISTSTGCTSKRQESVERSVAGSEKAPPLPRSLVYRTTSGGYQQQYQPEEVHSSATKASAASTHTPRHDEMENHHGHGHEHTHLDDDEFDPDFFDMERDPMTHFIFPTSPHPERKYMQSPTLELCAETSILDHSLEEIAYSPRHMQTPVVANQAEVRIEGHDHEAFAQPHLTSPINLSPMALPRRSRPAEVFYDTSEAFGTDFHGDVEDYSRQEPIAVSFSMDTL